MKTFHQMVHHRLSGHVRTPDYRLGMLLAAICFFAGMLPLAPLQGQNLVSAVLPSNSTPASGDIITVDIQMDMTGMTAPDNLLGSFTGSFSWNPTVLNYVSNSGILSGFLGNVNVDLIAGTLSFNGVNVSGVGGVFSILQLEFSVTGTAGATATLDLAYSAMLAAGTFTNLLPFLSVNGASITVADGTQENVVSTVIPSATTPAGGETLSVDIQIDMSSMSPPDSLLGSFTATLSWDPAVLSYLSDSGILSGFLGNVNVDTVAGTASFNGVNVNGVGGIFSVLQIEFTVTGNTGDLSPLNLSYSALLAAGSFTNLLPALVVHDATITVQEPSDILISIPDDLQGAAGDTVDVPVSLTLNGNLVESLGAAVKASGGQLSFVGFVTGPIVPGSFFDVSSPAPDSVRIGFFNAGSGPIAQDGLLVTLQFAVAIDAPEGDMALFNFSELSAADPDLKPLNVGGDDGKMTVINEVSIAGTVLYSAITGGGNPAKPVPDLDAELSQNGIPLQSTPTDASGIYRLSGISPGNNYRVEVRRSSGGIGAALTPTDALICFNAFLGNIILNGARQLACDVNCDKALNPTDALLIFNRFLGNVTQFPCGEDWRTYPAGYDIDATTDAWKTAPEGIDYASLSSDQSAQDYLAVVLGDADLSWPNPALGAPLAKAEAPAPEASLTLDLVAIRSATDRQMVTWRIMLQGKALRDGVTALGGELQYDPALWDVTAVQWGDAAGGGFQWDYHHTPTPAADAERAPNFRGRAPARLRFGGFSLSDAALREDGALLEIRARAKSTAALEENPPQLAALSAAAGDFRALPVSTNARNTSLQNGDAPADIPHEFVLEGNYPNPFNPSTHIRYRIPETALVSISVYNALGQKIRQLLDQQPQGAGIYEVQWNGRDDNGQPATSGLYFYVFRAKTAERVITQTRKMLMMK